MGGHISKLVFQPPPFVGYHYTCNAHLLDGHVQVEDLKLHTTSGALLCGAYIDYGFPLTVLYSHGNAEDLNTTVPFLLFDLCPQLQVNALCYDYEGYGGSEGSASEAALYRDIETCYSYLVNTKKLHPSTIALFGVSLGTAACVYLASTFNKDPFRGMFLQSPMCSVYRIAFQFTLSFFGDFLCSIDRIGHVKCKTLIVHGMNDEIIPFWHGQELLLRCTNPVNPIWVRYGSHNDLIIILQEIFFNRLHKFLHEECAVLSENSVIVSTPSSVAL